MIYDFLEIVCGNEETDFNTGAASLNILRVRTTRLVAPIQITKHNVYLNMNSS